MAIVKDPDLLNRDEVIYKVQGATHRAISLYPCGAVINAAFDPERTTGAKAASLTFNDAGASFQTWGVAPGDILCLKEGVDAGHWLVDTVPSETQITVESLDGASPSEWESTSETGLTYDIREPTGGNAADGATKQAGYSFAKEEWLNDTEDFDGDLFQYPFPYEPLGRETFELGGSVQEDWRYFTDDTRSRWRTGGWDRVNSSGVKKFTYAGIMTLPETGGIDDDAQVYYQPEDADTDPVNFVLLGGVNQAVEVHDVDGAYDTRTYMKLFLRKKARYYAQADLEDIGVTTMENIAYRFPLSHAVDPAITASDAELEGNTPWTGTSTIDSGSNGVTANVDGDTGTLTATGENFDVSGVAAGDVVYISGGTNDNGYFLVVSVDSATQLTLNTEEHGAFSGESSLDYETRTRYIITGRTDGAVIDVDGDTGTLTSATGGFSGVVATGDILRITESADPLRGVYKVVSVSSDTVLVINTEDQNFPGSTQSNVDFEILEPGMFLQYKKETITLGATGNLTFTANTRPTLDTITRASGSWITDGVTEGDVVTITGASDAANNGTFVVRSRTATDISVDTVHVLVTHAAEAATATAFTPFKRDINSITYPFYWRCFGNGATTAEVYEFEQREMRRATDIDNGPGTSRGDVTDLLMSFVAPTAKGLRMIIDDFDANDTNNTSFFDASSTVAWPDGVERQSSFVAAGTITYNANLVADSGPARMAMFFKNVPNTGESFGEPSAIYVDDADGQDIVEADISTSGGSTSFTFDYDGNTQGGRTPGANADVVIVAIGTDEAQHVLFEGTITRATGLTFALQAAKERVYSNP